MAMANITLKCTECGTNYTVTKKCYNRAEAENYETYMADKNGLCKDCWAKEQQTKKEAETKKNNDEVTAKLEAAGITLPSLEGSEKQIAWANQIRLNLFAALTKMGVNWNAIANDTHDATVQAEVDKLFQTSAKFWIDAKMNREKIITITVD